MKHPVQVCLTADIEFEINGSLAYPDVHRPCGAESVFRMQHDREEGLLPLVEPLQRFGLPATFFIETMQSIHFDFAPMQSVAERLRQIPGMDMQLHLHPCWLNFRGTDWPAGIKQLRTNDMMAGRGDKALAIIEEARDRFREITGQTPLALRTGNLSVDMNVYEAQAKAGIPLASNIGLAMAPSPDVALRQYGGLFCLHGVVEVPVTSFREAGLRGRRNKLLTLTGNSLWQLRRVLQWAYDNQQGPVVILTHVSEMAASPGLVTPPVFTARRNNQRRWALLCEYLSQSSHQYQVCSFMQGWDGWKQATEHRMPAMDAGLAGPASKVLARLGLAA